MNAPVTYIKQQVRDPDGAFELLWNNLPWEQREGAPRRECWVNPYGEAYTYGTGEYARTYEAHGFDETREFDLGRMLGLPPFSLIYAIMHTMNVRLGYEFDCCFVNGYDHGRQHLGWHADDSPEMDQDHAIATVSLGAEREIWFRRKPTSFLTGDMDQPEPAVEKLLLAHGSAAIMGAGMQRDWQHRIPKSSRQDCGPRLSLTYRKLVR